MAGDPAPIQLDRLAWLTELQRMSISDIIRLDIRRAVIETVPAETMRKKGGARAVATRPGPVAETRTERVPT
jgi:hypothetical protein